MMHASRATGPAVAAVKTPPAPPTPTMPRRQQQRQRHAAASGNSTSYATTPPPTTTTPPTMPLHSAPAYAVSPLNASVAPAAPGEFAPLRLGDRLPALWPPLLLAPMAGITSAPLRLTCQDAGAAACVSEMILAHELVAGSAKTRHLARFDPREKVRSAQLYAVRPEQAFEAARLLAAAGADHIDLNFGCP